MQTLLETSFTGLTGDISFDANGDVPSTMGAYQVVNLQAASLVNVGSVNTSSFTQTGSIIWSSGSTTKFSVPSKII